MSAFSRESRQKIQDAVAAVEKVTSGEVVPVVVPASSRYRWLSAALFLKGAFVAAVGAELVSQLSSWPWELSRVIMVSLTGGVLGGLLAEVPFIARWAIGTQAMDEEVQKAAREAFVTEGVVETRDRTGVLIYVSRLEHEIVILADRGIHEKVEKGTWEKLCEEFVHEVRAGREVEGLCQIIARVGQELARHFPRKSDDTNELSNELRGRPGDPR